jgi:preprotein translocase subunit SecA
LEAAKIHPVESIEDFVVSHLTAYATGLIKILEGQASQPVIKLPGYLHDFAQTQIPKWVESALVALSYQENVHYITVGGTICPVDFKTTGVVQSSTNWNNGLHQFIGLKHALKIAPETVTTNFLSNPAMISKYGGNMLGFTGTLGSDAGRNVLYSVYKVKLLALPETNFKRYIQFPDIVVPNEVNF